MNLFDLYKYKVTNLKSTFNAKQFSGNTSTNTINHSHEKCHVADNISRKDVKITSFANTPKMHHALSYTGKGLMGR